MSKQSEHNDGQKDGSQAGLFEQFCQGWNILSSEAYREGFKNGVDNQAADDDDDDDDD